MCLVKMKVERDDDPPTPPRRIVVRPASQTSQSNSHIILSSSRPVSRSHSHRSSRIISATVLDPPGPRAVQYITSSSIPVTQTTRLSNPRIVYAHAPSPPRSPRISHASIHSSHSHSRHSSLGGGGSPRGSRTRVVEDGGVVYVSRQSTYERPRSGQYLTTAAAALGSRDEVLELETGTRRQNIFLEEGPLRTSRSITYATTGPRLSRERVVVEEAGRRRESYRPIG